VLKAADRVVKLYKEENVKEIPEGVPDFARKEIINAPEDAFVGVGSAKMASMPMSMTMAAKVNSA
jgi:hypothetical protein